MKNRFFLSLFFLGYFGIDGYSTHPHHRSFIIQGPPAHNQGFVPQIPLQHFPQFHHQQFPFHFNQTHCPSPVQDSHVSQKTAQKISSLNKLIVDMEKDLNELREMSPNKDSISEIRNHKKGKYIDPKEITED